MSYFKVPYDKTIRKWTQPYGQLNCFFESCSISIQLNGISTEIEQKFNENGIEIEQKLYENWARTMKDRLRAPGLYTIACTCRHPELSFHCPSSISIIFLFDFCLISVQISFNWIEIEWKLNRIEKSRWVDPY